MIGHWDLFSRTDKMGNKTLKVRGEEQCAIDAAVTHKGLFELNLLVIGELIYRGTLSNDAS